jgi:homoserine O-acetyltransferase
MQRSISFQFPVRRGQRRSPLPWYRLRDRSLSESHAAKFIGQFDPNAYLFLSRAMDLFDLADHGQGSLAESFKHFKVQQVLIIGVETDLLFPIEQQTELADGLRESGKEVQFARLDSLQGHDAFLVDMDRFRPVIGNFLRGL